MWDNILKFLNENKDALGWLFGSGVILAILGGLYRFIIWLIKENRLRRIRTNDNFPFKIIPPNSNVAKIILGGADDDPLADRNIPYQQRLQGRNTRRELEELIEDHRWILITGRTGLGKTREAVQLAQSLNNEGWTILYLTRETWLDAPAKLPNNVPERKLLFFLDDLNKKCLSSKAEIRPNASESFTIPIYESFQPRLQRTLDAFETFCGKSEIKVVATARNEKTSEFEEPSEWNKLSWAKYTTLWEKFKLIDLPEPDNIAEEKLLAESAKKAEIFVSSVALPILAERNDGTFRNLVENLHSSRSEGFKLSPENFRDTLKGTWRKRYQKAIQKYPETKEIYDAIELLRTVGVQIEFSTVRRVAAIIANGNILHQVKFKRRCLSALRELSKAENILHPRDGQIEAKGYKLDIDVYLAKLYYEIGREYFSRKSVFERFIAFHEHVRLTPKSYFLNEKLSFSQKITATFSLAGPALNNIGLAYSNLGFPLHALRLFRNSLEVKRWDLYSYLDRRTMAHSWNNLGRSYYLLDQYDDAISALKKAIEIYPGYKYPWYNLGDIYHELKQNEDAIQAYKKAIALDQKYASAWNGLGNVYYSLQQYEHALEAYEKAIEIDPKYAFPWNGLGNVYAELGRYEEAILALQKAIELDPKDPFLWSELGIIYSFRKEYEKALLAYQNASKIKPDHGPFCSSVISILKRLGRNDEAIEKEEHARKLMEKENNYARACFEAICGNPDKALLLLKVALEQKQIDIKWARQDPDFDFIRDDPRFKELVGLK
jgi:tetratricopeptide (TPR) repeat protein